MQEVFPLIEFYPSALIFEEHSLADSAYILKEGRVEISMQRDDEKVILAELKPVSIFGEMALLSKEKKRTATAKALDRVKVIRIDKDNFDQQLADTPSVIAAVLHGVTQRLIDTTLRLHPGYVERRENNSPLPPEVAERRNTKTKSSQNRIPIQQVRSEQKISMQPLGSYREVRQVTITKTEGVRVDYFDGDIKWFSINTLVYVVN
jgi:CRP-like cAMP-binding protein